MGKLLFLALAFSAFDFGNEHAFLLLTPAMVCFVERRAFVRTIFELFGSCSAVRSCSNMQSRLRAVESLFRIRGDFSGRVTMAIVSGVVASDERDE